MPFSGGSSNKLQVCYLDYIFVAHDFADRCNHFMVKAKANGSKVFWVESSTGHFQRTDHSTYCPRYGYC